VLNWRHTEATRSASAEAVEVALPTHRVVVLAAEPTRACPPGTCGPATARCWFTT
jgi:hypothetical protein